MKSNHKVAFEMLNIIIEIINNEQSRSQLNRLDLLLEKLNALIKNE